MKAVSYQQNFERNFLLLVTLKTWNRKNSCHFEEERPSRSQAKKKTTLDAKKRRARCR